MTNKQAIAAANASRPNMIDDTRKAEWLMEIDAQVAERMGVEEQENKWPAEQDLLMPSPHAEMYVLYLMAKIDLENEEFELYQDDAMVANNAAAEAYAWYRRTHRYHKNTSIKV